MTTKSQTKIIDTFNAALKASAASETPYQHWIISNLFPNDVLQDIQGLEFPIGDLEGVSGKRELHNDTRHYFDQENIAAYPIIDTVAGAFQTPKMIGAIEQFFDIDLDDTFLRIEYAQDVTGFWLEPHTDLGVKKLTVLIYLSDGEGHDNLGTDIFKSKTEWHGRTPFAPNMALAFVPGDATYHGFQKRQINGVRKTLILNYVTKEWRDREQLAFPDQTVSSA